MFPERGEEIACDHFWQSCLNTPGNLMWVYSHRQVFERCVQKRLEKLDGIVASTVYPILYCLETVFITGVRDYQEKFPVYFLLVSIRTPSNVEKRNSDA